jgi:hypothetical protein
MRLLAGQTIVDGRDQRVRHWQGKNDRLRYVLNEVELDRLLTLRAFIIRPKSRSLHRIDCWFEGHKTRALKVFQSYKVLSDSSEARCGGGMDKALVLQVRKLGLLAAIVETR